MRVSSRIVQDDRRVTAEVSGASMAGPGLEPTDQDRPAQAHADHEWTHAVQLIPSHAFPADRVAAFLVEGLSDGDAAIAIATPEHRAAIEAACAVAGLDVAEAIESSRLLLLDAQQTLAACMRDGQPDRSRFNAALVAALARVSKGTGHTRVYGEMVDLFWRDGQPEAALALEDCWNELLTRVPARLLCGYDIARFAGERGIHGLRDVCSHHDSVHVMASPADQVWSDSNQLIAELQVHQRHAAVEAERRRVAETAQQAALTELRAVHQRFAELQTITTTLSQAVQGAEQRLHESSRRKDDFMAVLGHELRNPLAPMLTALQVMKLRGDRTCERERALIERQLLYVARLVDDLLDVSRITRGQLQLQRSVVELGSVLAHAIELASPLIQQHEHRLVVDTPGERCLVDVDSTRLAQALANLLTNAAKYTEPGGQISVQLFRDGHDAVIVIRDEGVGIPSDMLADIFEPFVQVERTMERSQGGLGLGLTLVKTLIELHGGTVHATSGGPGRGSAFHVRLPALAPVRAPGPGETSAPGELRGETSNRRRVLVVDDNPDGADSLAEVLRLLGHDADVAYDGRSAVAKAVADTFDLVVLDINLPGWDGYEIARRIRQQAPAGPHRFVAMTGFGTEDDHKRSRDEGFIAHLVKPIDHERLMSIIEST
jgi:signal transduction histidine kinase